MRTTQSIFSRSSILLFAAFMAVFATVGFAHPTKTKSNIIVNEKSFHLVGVVDHVNKDRTFDLVTFEGEHYTVHMAKDTAVNAYAPFPDEKTILSFDDLFRGARVSFTAEPIEQTYSSTDHPMPVTVR